MPRNGDGRKTSSLTTSGRSAYRNEVASRREPLSKNKSWAKRNARFTFGTSEQLAQAYLGWPWRITIHVFFSPLIFVAYSLLSHQVFSIPFNSRNKWHLTIHHLPHVEGEYTMFFKGASERVVTRYLLRSSYEHISVRCAP